MSVSIEKKKAEAVLRMRQMGVYGNTIRQFEKEGYINRSEPPLYAFYWVEGEELERIRRFEKDYNALVYMVIRSCTTLGVMDSYLYVSDYEEEWEMDREYLRNGEPCCYVYNNDMPDCSEFGDIGIKMTPAASPRRIW